MAKLKDISTKPEIRLYEFWCPRCLTNHIIGFDTRSEEMLWNKDPNSPTINFPIIVGKCHLNVLDGKIRFLDNETVDMVDK